jgi:hypothetical protein
MLVPITGVGDRCSVPHVLYVSRMRRAQPLSPRVSFLETSMGKFVRLGSDLEDGPGFDTILYNHISKTSMRKRRGYWTILDIDNRL